MSGQRVKRMSASKGREKTTSPETAGRFMTSMLPLAPRATVACVSSPAAAPSLRPRAAGSGTQGAKVAQSGMRRVEAARLRWAAPVKRLHRLGGAHGGCWERGGATRKRPRAAQPSRRRKRDGGSRQALLHGGGLRRSGAAATLGRCAGGRRRRKRARAFRPVPLASRALPALLSPRCMSKRRRADAGDACDAVLAELRRCAALLRRPQSSSRADASALKPLRRSVLPPLCAGGRAPPGLVVGLSAVTRALELHDLRCVLLCNVRTRGLPEAASAAPARAAF